MVKRTASRKIGLCLIIKETPINALSRLLNANASDAEDTGSALW